MAEQLNGGVQDNAFESFRCRAMGTLAVAVLWTACAC